MKCVLFGTSVVGWHEDDYTYLLGFDTSLISGSSTQYCFIINFITASHHKVIKREHMDLPWRQRSAQTEAHRALGRRKRNNKRKREREKKNPIK